MFPGREASPTCCSRICGGGLSSLTMRTKKQSRSPKNLTRSWRTLRLVIQTIHCDGEIEILLRLYERTIGEVAFPSRTIPSDHNSHSLCYLQDIVIKN